MGGGTLLPLLLDPEDELELLPLADPDELEVLAVLALELFDEAVVEVLALEPELFDEAVVDALPEAVEMAPLLEACVVEVVPLDVEPLELAPVEVEPLEVEPLVDPCEVAEELTPPLEVLPEAVVDPDLAGLPPQPSASNTATAPTRSRKEESWYMKCPSPA